MRQRLPISNGAPVARRAPARATGMQIAVALPATPTSLLQLQRCAGNRAAARLLELQAPSQHGARALARDETKDKPPSPPPPPKEHLDKWKAAGPFGDDVLKLLSELLTPAEVAGLLKGVGEKVEGAVGDPAGKTSGKAIGATAQWAADAAAAWLKGPKGEKLLAALRKQLGDNPDPYYGNILQSVASSLMIAAKLYADNKLDPPNLEKELKLVGGKLALTGGLDLGKPKDGWLQESKFGLKYTVYPQLTLGLGGTLGMADKGMKWSTYTTVDAGLLKDYLTASAKLDLKSDPAKSTVQLGAGGKAGGFDYKLGSTFGLTTLQLDALTAHLGYTSKDKTLGWLTDLSYKVEDGKDTYAARLAVGSVVGRYTLFLDASGKFKSDAPSGDVTGLLGYKFAPNLNLGLVGGLGYGATGLEAKGPSAWQVHGGLAYKPDAMPGWATFQYNAPVGGGGLPAFLSLGYVVPLGKEPSSKK